jgi:dihydroneopterin aldolase
VLVALEAGDRSARVLNRELSRPNSAILFPMIRAYTLRLHAIRFRANIGASRFERETPQEIVVDVTLELPVAALPKRDHRREVVDYETLVRWVVEVGVAEPYRLLETYAERLLAKLLDETPATRVCVAATKLRVPGSHNVDRAVVELTGVKDDGGQRDLAQ